MPQASDELRAQWPGGDAEAIGFLKSQGYVLTTRWTWMHNPARAPTDRERSSAQYLIDEWDFDGIE